MGMERLTRRMCGGWGVKAGYELNTLKGMRAVVDRLAAYENTGLEPDQVDQIRRAADHMMFESAGDFARYSITNFESLEEYRALGSIDRLHELVQAEKDGRLVVLPCKVGDTVYMPVGRWNTITGFEEGKCDGFHIARDGILQIKALCWTGNHGTYGIPGETVFLTREEAETALGGDGDVDGQTHEI